MNKEVFALWLEYLRSGAYKVNKFRMTNGAGRYSAIGVLADLLIKEYGEGRWADLDLDLFTEEQQEYKYGFCWCFTPKYMELDPETNEIVPVEAIRPNYYRVYVPLQQWFWPGATFDIQDTIYSWTDSQQYSLADVSDALEDGLYFKVDECSKLQKPLRKRDC